MNLALFDFDGTITSREMFAPFMHFAVAPGRRALGSLVFAPLLLGYKLGVVSGTTIRSTVVQFGFRGAAEASVNEAGKRFARDVLPTVVRPEALERIQWHKEQGDRVVVVSGSLDLYLSHWCRTHELELICSILESKDGVLTGGYRGEQCVGKEKPRRVQQVFNLEDFSTVYAYGDTKEDLDMLGIAHKKYFCWNEVA